MYQSGLSNIYDIDVTSNEYISKQSLNRNIKKLWENDICLYNMYNNLMNGAVIINYTSEKTYDYFPSLTNSEYEPYILKDASNNKINVLDLTIKDLQNKGTIDPISYSENSWHNTRSMLTEQQS